MANILFLDQPVGSGFSYSRTPLDKTSDTNEVKMIHEFLQKWLSKHPQFFSNPFYVIGDSYSGKIVPALVQKISKGIFSMKLYMLQTSHQSTGLCARKPSNIS
ncbi:unnamed protein product [Brassica oleracea var. botrytis]